MIFSCLSHGFLVVLAGSITDWAWFGWAGCKLRIQEALARRQWHPARQLIRSTLPLALMLFASSIVLGVEIPPPRPPSLPLSLPPVLPPRISMDSATLDSSNRTAVAVPEAETGAWLDSLGEGYRSALQSRRPILVRFGAPWCPACKAMEKEIAAESLQAELARWTLVYVDVDTSPEEAKTAGVTMIPAFRVLTPDGRSIASRNGMIDAKTMLIWLREQHTVATAGADSVLMATSRPNATAVFELIGQFQNRDPALREAAIRRLLPYPDVARSAAVEAFATGDLTTRLAVLELLTQWKAPVEGVDPWRPDTVTTERLAALDRWAVEGTVVPPEKPEELSDAQLASARLEIDRLLAGTPAEATAAIERLARLGPALLPEVYSRLDETNDDQRQRRLLELRYRLVADDALVLRWPGGLARLAATDPKDRQRAAEQLAAVAGPPDQQLLLELFSDPDAMVREISLRGLQRIGGSEATAALVRLLKDPELNVRAAVLKQLAESPQPGLAPEIAKYLKTETDVDLIGHAIRCLKQAGGKEVIESLVALLEHEAWQVRAEAVEALGGSLESSGGSVTSELRAEAYAALAKRLGDSDAFVISRTITALDDIDIEEAVDPLIEAAKSHPELTIQIIGMLAEGQSMRAKALPRLREFTRHKDPAIRAATITGLAQIAADDLGDELTVALSDSAGEVRMAAAGALLSVLQNHRDGNALMLSVDQPVLLDEGSFSGDLVGEIAEPVVAPPRPSWATRAARGLLGALGREPEPQEDTPAVEEDSPEMQPLIEIVPEQAPAPDIDSQPPRIPSGDPFSDAADPFGDADDSPTLQLPGLQPVPEVEIVPPTTTLRGSFQSKPRLYNGPSQPFAGPAPGVVGHAVAVAQDGDPAPSRDQFLADFYSGKGRPEWTEKAIPPLLKMLEAEDREERVVAAMALVPLGKADVAMPVLMEVIKDEPQMRVQAMSVLGWLTWEQRVEAFGLFRELLPSEDNFAQLVGLMIENADSRAADLLWEILADEKVQPAMAAVLKNGLQQAYSGGTGQQFQVVDGEIVAVVSDGNGLTETAAERARQGSDVQRVVALALLLDTARKQAVEIARPLIDDAAISPELREAAFKILMAGQPEGDRIGTATAALAGDNAVRRKIVVALLVGQAGPMQYLEQYGLVLTMAEEPEDAGRTEGSAVVPEPPMGLKPEHLRPLIDDDDPQVAAQAGYLLALLGQKEGLPPLLAYWKTQKENDDSLDRLVYRAIASLDDSSRIAELRDIRQRLEEHEMADFYWTIRIMSGLEILNYRKELRRAVGMENLQ